MQLYLKGAKNSNDQQKQKDAKKLATQKRLGFTPMSQEQKCYQCAQRNISCDGKYPCIKCNTLLKRRSCRPQGRKDLPSCNWCKQRSGRGCDCGRSCKGCTTQKRNCTCNSQNGLLKRTYKVPGEPLLQGFSTTGALAKDEPSDEECTHCQRLKLSCDGKQPCYQCTKINPQIAGCHYQKSDGTYESWEI